MRDIVWRCVVLVVVLGAALALGAEPDGHPRRARVGRLALILVLTTATIYLVRLSLRQASPHLWNHARYIGWLLPPILTVGWAMVLARPQMRARGSRMRRRVPDPLPALLGLLVWSVALVSAADIGVTWLGWATDAPWKEVTR